MIHCGSTDMGEPMWNALKIREDLSAGDLRQLARKEGNRRTAMRMLAIANALEGMSRAEAARVVGMDRQALRDAVVRYNAEGVAGLYDRPKPGRKCFLTEGQQAALKALVLRGPDPGRMAFPATPSPTFAAWSRSASACVTLSHRWDDC